MSASGPGRFVYDVRNDRWEWDDDVYMIHGYTPGEVEPTTKLFLKHKHKADRKRVEDAFRSAIRTGEPFNLYYRILAAGTERRVVVVGEGLCGDDGHVSELSGYYLDLTEEFDAESAAAADEAVEASARGRATIEQAKGVLMLGYGLDDDAAFAMLRWWSRNRNLKVREIAERLLSVARAGAFSHPGLRRLLDGLIHDLTEGRDGTPPAMPVIPPLAVPGMRAPDGIPGLPQQDVTPQQDETPRQNGMPFVPAPASKPLPIAPEATPEPDQA